MMCSIYAPWFGELPFYANDFLSCCAKAVNIQWCIASDQAAPIDLPANIFWQVVDVNESIKRIFPGAPHRVWGHKLCDLKPFWHLIFSDDRIINTSYRGWIDWDVHHDLSNLPFNFGSAKFTPGGLCSPLFITRCDAALDVYPIYPETLLLQTDSCAWDEVYYLQHIHSTIVQQGMTPEIDLLKPVGYALHLYRAKYFPALYAQWIRQYFKPV